MKIREAVEADIPEIVNLLKLGLGESLMPKSEKYWRWKHIDNPFGPSLVLLAEDDEKIVGVRAFMRWEWKKENEIVKAVRAVDTVTHPQYRGKGVFKKLTLALLEECRNEGFDMVYNTPNKYSKPGYIKMGWETVGFAPVRISINRPLNIIKNLFLNTDVTKEFLKINDKKLHLPQKVNCINSTMWTTSMSIEYLNWRYQQIPIIDYYSENVNSAGIIYRLKGSRLGIELRIVDVYGKLEDIKTAIKKVSSEVNHDYMSMSGFYNNLLPVWMMRKMKLGPSVTVRKLNKDTHEFLNFNKWEPGLGALEVF